MTPARGEGASPTAGGPGRHIPVLRAEALAALDARAGGHYLDGTFGAGGYTQAILAVDGARVLALDRDPRAIADGQALVAASAGRLALVEARFGDLADIAQAEKLAPLDGVVLDIGVSSMQLDEAERGFSFRNDGPLDMRMSGAGRSAADLVNELDDAALADIFYQYGEERASRRIARAIAMDRKTTPFTRTRQLAGLIARIMPGKPGDIHPATRVFQALRIAVNDELGELSRALHAAEQVLKPGGRLVVVTFHSLEDRMVKLFFTGRSGRGASVSRHMPNAVAQGAASFTLPGKQPITAGPDELRDNLRSRSAKLRCAIRTAAPALAGNASIAPIAGLPDPTFARRRT